MYSFFNWDYYFNEKILNYLFNDYFLTMYKVFFFFFLAYIYIINILLFKKIIVDLLLKDLKYLNNNWYQLLFKYFKSLSNKSTIIFLLFNLHYIGVYLKNKSWFISMIIRLMEINKEKEKYKFRKIYIRLQFLEFFYLRIVLNKIYATLNRIIYTNIIISLNIILKYFIKYNIKIFIMFKINILILYLMKYFNIILSFISYNIKIFILNIYEIIRLEAFIIYINENNFIAGLINNIYIFLNNNITVFNKLETWEKNRLPNKILDRVKLYFNNIHYYFINKNNNDKNINIVNLYNFILIIYNFVLYKKTLYYLIFIKKFNHILLFLFLYLGFINFIIYDCVKKIFSSLINKLIKKRKYFFFFIYILIIYKLNLIYIINITNIYFIKLIFNKYLLNFIAYFSTAFFDLISIMDKKLFDEELNAELIKIWIKDYLLMLNNRNTYFNNTVIGRIFNLFRLDTNDWQILYEKKSLITKDPAYIKKKWLNFWRKIGGLFINELKMFFIILKDFLIYKFFSVYKMHIFFYSNENLYYYIIKKIITIIYILIIYIICYFKFLYFYILPYYITSIYAFIFWILEIINWITMPIFSLIRLFFNIGIIPFVKIVIKIAIICLYLTLNYMQVMFKNIYIFNVLLYMWVLDIFYINYIELNYIFNYIYINKSIYINIIKEFFFNYLRLDIFKFTHNYNTFNVIGNKVKGIIVFDLDIIDIEAIKKYGIKGNEINSILALAPLRYKFRDFYMFYNNKYIYNNIYLFNQINLNLYIYVLNLFKYNYIFIIIIIYIFIIFKYNKYINYNLTLNKYNYNIIWYDLKKNFKYKLLKNEKLFLKALYFYRKISGKKKNIDNIFNLLNNIFYKNINWKKIIDKKLLKIKLSFFKFNYKKNKILNNYLMEKFNYKKNFFFFYWKNLILNNYNIDYYLGKNKKMEFFYFFLSLIFRKVNNSSKLYTYLNNYSKIYYYKDFKTKYFNKIVINQSKLINDKFNILYKNETNIYKNVYSLNFRIEMPNFVFNFFWVGFILYIFLFKFHWRHYNLEISTRIITNFFYFKLLLINNNFMYMYDCFNYWFFMSSMFDVKNISYETSNYYLMEPKFLEIYRRFSLSKKIIINNDSLYLYKKNLAYNIINLEKKKYFINSYSLIIFYKILLLFKIIIFYKILLFPIKIFYKKNSYNLKFINIIENYKKEFFINKYYIYNKKFFKKK